MLLYVPLPSAARVDAVEGVTESQVQTWVTVASMGLDARAVAVLQQIDGADRRLLALRAYLRAGDSLPQRWSWSQQRLSEYATSTDGKEASADIDAVAAVFAASNPGFALRVNKQPRSLELQLANWNENATVAKVATSLVHSLGQQFGAAAVPPTPEALRRALTEWTPSVAAPLAAPGLSAHGQGSAFDFQIERDGEIVAGLDFASARSQWDAAGWTQRLRAAVSASGRPFEGPLQSPYEPWHYTYTPAK